MAFRNSKGKGEFFELGIRRHGGYLRLEFRRHGGVQDLEFPQRTDKRTDKSFYLMDFIIISSKIKQELMKMLTPTGAGYKTSIHPPVMCSFAEEN